jgi:hypothetical protein
MTITIRLTANALSYLREKVKGRRGAGAYVSSLLSAEQAREETRALVAEEREEERKREMSSRERWRQTGVNVD